MPQHGAGASFDSAALAVLIARLSGVADEMGAVLRRSASSANIKERADCSAAVFTAAGDLLAQAEHIPVHLGSMPASVRAAIDAFDGGRALGDGEQVVVNDPFAGGTHLNDITLVRPVRRDGELVGWVANRAHHADVGGMVPGSIPPDAVEIQQEGLRLPPVRLTDDVAAILGANSRTPAEREGDLAAQAGANEVGAARLLEVLAGHPDGVADEVLAYGERRMRAALSAIPDAEYVASDEVDGATIRLRVAKAGDAITFDFAGTDPQTAGNVNAVLAVTVSAVAFALRSAIDSALPANGGCLRPVTILAPAGSVVNAVAPAAVGAGNVEVSQRVADVCQAALLWALPSRVGGAGQGTMNNLIVGGDGWVSYETIGGGAGGGPRGPGASASQTAMTNTKNTPIEAFERAFPVLVRRYTLRSASGGVGLSPGGEGIEKELQVLVPATVSLITSRRSSAPWGAQGGGAGAVGSNWLERSGISEPLAAKCTVRVEPGDVVRVLTPGGGGWGRTGPVPELEILGPPSGKDVVIHDYSPAWPSRFQEERSRIAGALGARALAVEHVGSTSVPGLAAKAIIDILVVVEDPDDDAALIRGLTAAGYGLVVIEPEHRMFRSPARDVHVHVWPEGHEEVEKYLVFRDWLRHSAEDRELYASTKRELAAKGWVRMNDYADAKSDVIQTIFAHAHAWAEAGGAS